MNSLRMLTLSLALLASVVSSSPPVVLAKSPPNLTAIMQEYTKAVGGQQTLSGIKTVESVYTSTLLGRAVTITTISKAPASFVQRVHIDGTPLTLAVGFDGKTAWEQSPRGDVVTLTGSKRADAISQAAGLNNSEIFPQRWPTQLALKANETIDGKPYYVVAVQPESGSEHDLLLDTQTFLPVISREYEGDVRTLNFVKSFGKGPQGELTAALILSTHSSGPLPDITSKLVSTRDNSSVSDSIFAPPVPTNAPTTNT